MPAQTKILIFEDDPETDRLILHKLLKSNLKEQVKIVTDAEVAWDFLNDPAISAESLVAIFLDLEPPNMRALDLLGKIRRDRRLEHLHVVGMTTADSPKVDLAKCIALDVVTYVEKPLQVETFTKAIADSFHSSKIASKHHH